MLQLDEVAESPRQFAFQTVPLEIQQPQALQPSERCRDSSCERVVAQGQFHKIVQFANPLRDRPTQLILVEVEALEGRQVCERGRQRAFEVVALQCQ